MSVPPYPKYKNSGVEWLGDVPEHWDVRRLKFLAHVRGGAAKGRDLGGRETVQVPYLRVANVQDGYLDLEDISMIDIAMNELERYALRSGDVLMNEGGDFDKLGRGHIWRGEIFGCIHQNHVFAVRPLNIESEWLNLVTSAEYARFYFMTRSKQSTNLASISSSNIEELPVVCPPPAERGAIVQFVRIETEKIDALVEEQRRLIELLREKRQATISHAATKGLNADAPMKDSGFEWLGKVPHHWMLMPIRYAAKLESGHTPSRNHPEYWENCVKPWFTLADVWQIRESALDEVTETNEMVSELGLANSSARLLPKGTVMFSRTASVGFAAIMGKEMATSQDFANWICGPRLSPQFLLIVFRAMKGEFQRLMMGSTHNTIYMPDIQGLRFALPPIEEQQQIVSHVQDQSKAFDRLIQEAEKSTGLLKERRNALISAAVTGKIDVRGLVEVSVA